MKLQDIATFITTIAPSVFDDKSALWGNDTDWEVRQHKDYSVTIEAMLNEALVASKLDVGNYRFSVEAIIGTHHNNYRLYLGDYGCAEYEWIAILVQDDGGYNRFKDDCKTKYRITLKKGTEKALRKQLKWELDELAKQTGAAYEGLYTLIHSGK
jgi:hypothetical protein